MRVERCFGFVDLCGFTAFTERFGDELAVVALALFRTTLREIAARRGVRITKWLGDGAMLSSADTEATVAMVLEVSANADAMLAPALRRADASEGNGHTAHFASAVAPTAVPPPAPPPVPAPAGRPAGGWDAEDVPGRDGASPDMPDMENHDADGVAPGRSHGLRLNGSPGDDRLALRSGLARGPVIMFEGDDYIGRPTNVASRLCDAAMPGQVLATREVAAMAPRWVAASEALTYYVRGFDQPLEAARLQTGSSGVIVTDPVCHLSLPLISGLETRRKRVGLHGEGNMEYFCSTACALAWEQAQRGAMGAPFPI